MPGRAPALRVIDRLVVGPARIEPNRLTVPYAVERDGKRDTMDFVYRWEEPVFDPDGEADANLAAVLGAQVALNYGLFCREIVLHGPLDSVDRKFLSDAMENTSREIWVNKLLKPNPFLLPPVAGMKPRVLDAYTRAKVSFPNAVDTMREPWGGDARRHTILSSGGKDSLLTFGMLREIGVDIHPIFINESGRHWYTALRAFRWFTANVPATARVWTNSDRVFAWMLRHLPFVRKDFERVRADIYAIRLWTVAVFLFGAMPLLRKRGIGRLVIGDEFDCSTRIRTFGITHYDSLYDQSRWFDNALTRYFHRKSWGVSQFSILRPLSEMLIERVLAERYPELLRLQISCHSAHIDGTAVLPCGRCEKCRRIVGMLTALGTDPKMCGYTTEQIRQCLEAVGKHSVKQESAGADQLNYMLVERGILGADHPAKPHPEILKVRIDSERSPIDGVPRDLRRPFYEIALEHADGCVRRMGHAWLPFDILKSPDIDRPYALEGVSRTRSAKTPKVSAAATDASGQAGAPETATDAPGQSGAAKARSPRAATSPLSATSQKPSETSPGGKPMSTVKRPWILGELTWPEARDRFKEVDVALLPVGAIEQHGPHSPLDTDAFDADYLAQKVAEGCSDPKPFVLPLIPYGVSYHHEDFPGTISVKNDTLSRFVYEVGMDVARNGIQKLVIINGHGGNAPALQFAAQMINRDAHIFACVDTGETSDADISKICETPNDVHAGEIETSTTLAVRPHLVDMSKAKRCVPKFSIGYLDFTGLHSVEWYARTRKISREGILGDPTKATAEKGGKIWEISIHNLVEFVEHLKKVTLDEIHQRRY